ncbi:TPA: TIR domain-containing protein [Salmonella enterica subsp. enterica serovar Oslo]
MDIFQLYEIFAGKLGRWKVLVLRKGDIEIPSDLAGVLYTELDENRGSKRKLLSELAYAGVPFDKDKAFIA